MEFIAKLAEIVWVDIVLSGDNAIVIALACRGLPEAHRRAAIWFGVAGAVGARIGLLTIASTALGFPLAHLLGGAFLLYVAAKLWSDNSDGVEGGKERRSLLAAVATIVVADIIMSLDNVVSVAAIADQHYGLLVFGTLLSLPLMVFCASRISAIITKFPILAKASAVFLGFIAGMTIMGESFIDFGAELEFIIGVLCGLGVAAHGLRNDFATVKTA